MSTLHLLGTGAALSDPQRTTTMLAFQAQGSLIVVDCGGDVVQRLMEAGLPLEQIDALILTHTHPDHISGFPLFMEKIWLAQRRRPIPVYGLAETLELARRLFGCFDTSGWEGMPQIEWHEVPLEEGHTLLDNETWQITSSPGDHSVPVIALRVAAKRGGGSVAYSCDTAPSEAVRRLAEGAAILVHEATGDYEGHSSAADAAHIAAEAGVGRLLLVHLPPSSHLNDDTLAAARQHFTALEKGEELGSYEF